MSRRFVTLVAAALIVAVAAAGWLVLRPGPRNSQATGTELSRDVTSSSSDAGTPNNWTDESVAAAADGRVDRGAKSDAGARSLGEPNESLASKLRAQLVPPIGGVLQSVQVAFRGVPDGAEVSAATAAGQSAIELTVGPWLKAGSTNKLVVRLEVESPHYAKYMRWVTAEDVLAVDIVELVVQLEFAQSLDIVVVDQFGRAASGAVVIANLNPSSMEIGAVPDWRVEADFEGRAALRGLSRGDWTIHAG